MRLLIDKYHTPESLWTAFNVHSHEEFMKTFFKKGKFHAGVPEQIRNDYQKVERIFCYAYYHYPLIDEAFSTLTRIFEAAIKMRLDELGLSKKGNLESKIARLEPYSSEQLLAQWNHARKLRNHFAHPNPGSLMGITLMRGFTQMINILNTVFLNREIIESNENLLTKIRDEAKHLKEGLYKYIEGENAYLIYSAIPYSFIELNSSQKHLWVFHPVLLNFPQTMDKASFSNPIFKKLVSVKIDAEGLVGVDINTQTQIRLIQTENPKNMEMLSKYRSNYDSAEKEVKILFNQHLQSEINNEIVKFLYEEAWE